jgi:hypothetical protein
MESAVLGTTADGSPFNACTSFHANYSVEGRLLVWLIWDISNAVRQMLDTGNASQPLDLLASTTEREQRLKFDVLKYCTAKCDSMFKELDLCKEKLCM